MVNILANVFIYWTIQYFDWFYMLKKSFYHVLIEKVIIFHNFFRNIHKESKNCIASKYLSSRAIKIPFYQKLTHKLSNLVDLSYFRQGRKILFYCRFFWTKKTEWNERHPTNLFTSLAIIIIIHLMKIISLILSDVRFLWNCKQPFNLMCVEFRCVGD